MLSRAARKLLLDDWNNTAGDYPSDRCFHQLFEEQARSTPDAVALVCGDRRLSYADLEDRSARLATYLQQRGVISMQDTMNAMWGYLFPAADNASMPARVGMGGETPQVHVLDKAGQGHGAQSRRAQD